MKKSLWALPVALLAFAYLGTKLGVLLLGIRNHDVSSESIKFIMMNARIIQDNGVLIASADAGSRHYEYFPREDTVIETPLLTQLPKLNRQWAADDIEKIEKITGLSDLLSVGMYGLLLSPKKELKWLRGQTNYKFLAVATIGSLAGGGIGYAISQDSKIDLDNEAFRKAMKEPIGWRYFLIIYSICASTKSDIDNILRQQKIGVHTAISQDQIAYAKRITPACSKL